MPRADNSDRQFLTIKPQDVGTAVDGKPETFPFKKLNDIILTLQKRIFTLEGRTEPPIIRNHLTMLAPPKDPELPPAGSDKVSLFFNPSTNTLDVGEPGGASFSDAVNRVGQWQSDKDTGVSAFIEWDILSVGSAPFLWIASSQTINISEPGVYLLQSKLSVNIPTGGSASAVLAAASGTFSQDATVTVNRPATLDLHHLYVWEKLNDTLESISIFFTSTDVSATVAGSVIPAALAFVKLK